MGKQSLGQAALRADLDDTRVRLEAVEGWVTFLEVSRKETADSLASGAEITRQVQHLSDRLDALTLAVAEGISHVERAESRVRAVVQRARKEFAESGWESAGVEAEAETLRLVHGDGGDDAGVRQVLQDVAAPQPTRHEALRERLKQLKLSS